MANCIIGGFGGQNIKRQNFVFGGLLKDKINNWGIWGTK
jgi:hypothetical protein